MVPFRSRARICINNAELFASVRHFKELAIYFALARFPKFTRFHNSCRVNISMHSLVHSHIINDKEKRADSNRHNYTNFTSLNYKHYDTFGNASFVKVD